MASGKSETCRTWEPVKQLRVLVGLVLEMTRIKILESSHHKLLPVFNNCLVSHKSEEGGFVVDRMK
jgi:hypothetical protein